MSRTGVILPPEDDPDPTDRLPELQLASADGSGDPHVDTGTWRLDGTVADAVAREQALELEERLGERDAAVTELTVQLKKKTASLTRVEKDLKQARSELAQAQKAAAGATDLEKRLQALEENRLELTAQRDEHRAAIGRLEDQLSESREAEQRLERQLADVAAASEARELARTVAEEKLLGGEAHLAELEAQHAQLQAQLADATHETLSAIQRHEFERLQERSTALKNALTVAREAAATLESERDGLRQRLEQKTADLAAATGALREQERYAETLLERLRNAEARSRFVSDLQDANLPPPAEAPRLGELTRMLGDERVARAEAEEALKALEQAHREAVAARAAPLRRCLVRLDEGKEAEFLLAPPRVAIGRTPDNDLQVRESYISRSHAIIKLGPDTAIVEDVDSRNGLFVNEKRVARELLHHGDIVMLGKARFRFESSQQ